MTAPLWVVLTTFPGAEEAARVIGSLVEERLIACGTIVPGATSIYRWQGALETGSETLALLKTTAADWPRLRERLRALHPYQVPEIVALPAAEVDPAYAGWVATSTARGVAPAS